MPFDTGDSVKRRYDNALNQTIAHDAISLLEQVLKFVDINTGIEEIRKQIANEIKQVSVCNGYIKGDCSIGSKWILYAIPNLTMQSAANPIKIGCKIRKL